MNDDQREYKGRATTPKQIRNAVYDARTSAVSDSHLRFRLTDGTEFWALAVNFINRENWTDTNYQGELLLSLQQFPRDLHVKDGLHHESMVVGITANKDGTFQDAIFSGPIYDVIDEQGKEYDEQSIEWVERFVRKDI